MEDLCRGLSWIRWSSYCERQYEDLPEVRSESNHWTHWTGVDHEDNARMNSDILW